MKTIKGGGWYLPLSPDGNFLLTLGQNKVYVHDLPDLKKTETFKIFSHVSGMAMSHNGKYLAAKNASGKAGIIEYPSGKILGTCPMEKKDGDYFICFSPDDKFMLDFDRHGNLMRLDLPETTEAGDEPLKLKHKLLYKFDETISGNHRISGHMGYDEFKNEIFVIYENYVFTSPIENIDFKAEKIAAAPSGFNHVFIGKERNLIFDNGNFCVFDKDWNKICSAVPKDIGSVPVYAKSAVISDNGKMLFAAYADKAYLFELSVMEAVYEWNSSFIASARFLNNDTMIAVSGWSGTTVEKIR